MRKVVIEIPQFIEHIVISKKRRPKYKTDEHGNLKLINKRTAGKERRWKINGQALYSGMNPFMRSKIVRELKKYLYTYIRPIEFIDFTPVSIELVIHQLPGTLNKEGNLVNSWDLGNQEFIWFKCFEDALCGNVEFEFKDPPKGKKRKIIVPRRDKYPAKIKDDSVLYITERICRFKEVKSSEERKLVFIIKELNNEIN